MLFTKSRAKFALILSPLFLAAGLPAQTTSSIRIYTNPPGLRFYVDGQLFTSAATLLWPQGSKHSLTTDIDQIVDPQKHYSFSQMNTNLGLLNASTITADPDLTWVQLNFTLEYGVTLNYYPCPEPATIACLSGSPALILINGQPFTHNGVLYVGANSGAIVQVVPSAGWVFKGWLPSPGVGNLSQAFLLNLIVTQPITLYPVFERARPVTVSLVTTPPGLQVLLDRTPTRTPITLDWGVNSTHQLGGISPQYDLQGKIWVFGSWSDGGGYSHSYTVAPGPSAISLSATYVPGVLVSVGTNPPGLKVSVDGSENNPSTSFAWAVGSAHTVSAAPTQLDARGNAYQFVSWSNNGPETQQIITSSDTATNRYIANYQLAGSLNLQSSPAGVPMQVDGETCTTPCSVIRSIGTTVNVTAPASSMVSEGARLDFRAWTDSSSATRTMTVSAQPQTLTASYTLRYQLQAASNPDDGASWQTTPASPDMFFDAQSWVRISANTKPGYQFLSWGGDASGSQSTTALQMTAPHSVMAKLNPVPYINPGGIQNSAADTPQDTVAPGSAVAIYGVNLAPDLEIAPNGPLAETLQNVTVRIGSQALPLYFVSPSQINVQLPSSLGNGRHTLTVHVEGKPDARQDFTVARNAPGLFSNGPESAPVALATHQDGSVISAKSPARHGEVVTLYGTGLGPYHPAPPDGVPVPSGTHYALADPAKLVVGSHQANPTWAGAAPAKIGVAMVQFKIDESVARGTSVAVKVRVNQSDSNTVMLPVE